MYARRRRRADLRPLDGIADAVNYDLDLLKGEARYKSEKFMTAWNWFEATDFPMAWGWELAVMLATPGFALQHFRMAFAWQTTTAWEEVPKIVRYFSDDSWNVQAAAQENFESVTLQDGEDFLHALLEMRPKYADTVPWCVTQSLRQLRADGARVSDLCQRFKIRPHQVSRFWSEDRFDPFTLKDKLCDR